MPTTSLKAKNARVWSMYGWWTLWGEKKNPPGKNEDKSCTMVMRSAMNVGNW